MSITQQQRQHVRACAGIRGVYFTIYFGLCRSHIFTNCDYADSKFHLILQTSLALRAPKSRDKYKLFMNLQGGWCVLGVLGTKFVFVDDYANHSLKTLVCRDDLSETLQCRP